jgi:hypothetical protein
MIQYTVAGAEIVGLGGSFRFKGMVGSKVKSTHVIRIDKDGLQCFAFLPLQKDASFRLRTRPLCLKNPSSSTYQMPRKGVNEKAEKADRLDGQLFQ